MNKKSGLELMRIISMLYIIFFHIIRHCYFIELSSGGSKLLLILAEAFFVVHVNSFILLTGYFQSKKDAKLSKVISIFNTTWFYKILCFVGIVILVKYFSFSNSIELTFHQKLTSILPLDRNTNWYINCYLVTYIFSPFLNILINKLDQKQFKKFLMISFIVFTIIGTLVIGDVVPTYTEGRSIFTFIFLYFVGAYLGRYPIEKSRLFNAYTDKMQKYIFLIGYVVLALVGTATRMTYESIHTLGGFYTELGEVLRMLSISFLSPIVIIQSIFYFLYFKNMKFSSKVINFIGGTTFGIYLLHENQYIRENIYIWLGMEKYANHGIKLLGLVIALGIVMFIACMIIEIIRKGIYKFFYKRKFAAKLREKIKDFIKSLGLDINY